MNVIAPRTGYVEEQVHKAERGMKEIRVIRGT
jgi:hypothetical protein